MIGRGTQGWHEHGWGVPQVRGTVAELTNQLRPLLFLLSFFQSPKLSLQPNSRGEISLAYHILSHLRRYSGTPLTLQRKASYMSRKLLKTATSHRIWTAFATSFLISRGRYLMRQVSKPLHP